MKRIALLGAIIGGISFGCGSGGYEVVAELDTNAEADRGYYVEAGSYVLEADTVRGDAIASATLWKRAEGERELVTAAVRLAGQPAARSEIVSLGAGYVWIHLQADVVGDTVHARLVKQR